MDVHGTQPGSAEMPLPDSLRKYFWDCRFEQLSWYKYRRFISERILQYGDDATLTVHDG